MPAGIPLHEPAPILLMIVTGITAGVPFREAIAIRMMTVVVLDFTALSWVSGSRVAFYIGLSCECP